MTAKKVNIELLTDLPIKSEVDDKFGRKDFVNAIADIIYSQSTEVNAENESVFKNVDENLIIGLYGSWGHGKSSVINLLNERLKEKQLQTVYFNPWMYGSENQLIASLFKVILQHTSLTDEPLKKLGDLFKKYFSLISIVDQQTADVGKAIIDSFDTDKELVTAEEIKEAIDKILSGTTNPLTIFIDDVDRLSKDEIHVLFKTLRLIASFKHVIYVVAFDFEMVSKSIKEKYVDGNEEDGKAFLEKIIQIPIRIPEISKDELQLFASELISKTCEINIVSNPIIKLIFEHYFNTPRDVIRFVNSFRFTYHYIKESIPRLNLLIIELIRTKIHPLFEIIKMYYKAIKSNNPDDFININFKQFLMQKHPSFFEPSGGLNISNKEFSSYNKIFHNLFSTKLDDMRFTQLQPINGTRPNQPIRLKQYLDQINALTIPLEGFRNPQTLLIYFEKSAEINQDEAPTEH